MITGIIIGFAWCIIGNATFFIKKKQQKGKLRTEYVDILLSSIFGAFMIISLISKNAFIIDND